MIEIRNTDVHNLERAIVASGNPMTVGEINTKRAMTDDDVKRAVKLGNQSGGHDHYLCGILVTMDMKYPLYISPELQRYHWFEIVSSQSTMHRLSAIVDSEDCYNYYVSWEAKADIDALAQSYNENPTYNKRMELRSNLPWGFEMWMTITTNYLQLKNIYKQRHDHRLKEDWGNFCDWCDSLPMFNELTGCRREK